MSLYTQAAERLAVLDGRETGYQYALSDVPFDGAAAPGRFFADDFLRDVGVPADVIAREDLREPLQWALAVAHCEAFQVQEELILWFDEVERARLGDSRSIRLLVEEEAKHAAGFSRFAQALKARHPEWLAAYERGFAESRAVFGRKQDASQFPSPSAYHHMFWLLVLHFEEYTVWVEQRLRGAGAQPAWAELHRLHRIEELQHLATDSVLLTALEVPRELRAAHARGLLATLAANFWHYVPVHPAQAVLAAHFGVELKPTAPMTRLGFWREVRQSPVFKRTRELLAYLDPKEVPPAPAA